MEKSKMIPLQSQRFLGILLDLPEILSDLGQSEQNKVSGARSNSMPLCFSQESYVRPRYLDIMHSSSSVGSSSFQGSPVGDSPVMVRETRGAEQQDSNLQEDPSVTRMVVDTGGPVEGVNGMNEKVEQNCLLWSKSKERRKYQDAEIVRTRDPQLLSQCDVVVDVGGEYDPSRNRYDHHQRSFCETMNSLYPDKPWVTKLSSAGLVYAHFGTQILATLLGTDEEDPIIPVLYDKMYENFVEEIDAIDNGVSQFDGEQRYNITTNLSSRVGHLNPRWNEPDQDTEAGFKKAMELAGTEFVSRLDFYHRSWLPARSLVEEAIRQRFQADGSGEVVILAQGRCPWKEHLFQVEKEINLEKQIKYVIYPDQSAKWRVQCVPTGPNTFQNRLSLPEDWRGLRADDLSSISGIPGCIFVHASGFIGGNETQEGALEMARKALTS
ncbi:MYG1 exonuclease-like [Bufo bufo]|uniref:MYG1 exonuclease-like n=1 Tax=Bufo bufo TaxID=8384 RepID=UPI001ABEB3A5|nr:MYG1 exonuclease-like [Bufo bufo]